MQRSSAPPFTFAKKLFRERQASRLMMPIPKSLVVGAAAGLVGAFVMQQFRSAWNQHSVATPEDGVFGLDREADLKSADMLTNFLLGRKWPEADAEKLALVLHYAYGALAGAVYASTVTRVPVLRAGKGTLFAMAVWFFGDELPITFSGISDPFERTARSHGSAVAAHLLFGLATELSRKMLTR